VVIGVAAELLVVGLLVEDVEVELEARVLAVATFAVDGVCTWITAKSALNRPTTPPAMRTRSCWRRRRRATTAGCGVSFM